MFILFNYKSFLPSNKGLFPILLLMFLESYQKVDLAGELSKIGVIEVKNRKGIRLLHELNKIASISCPEKVDRLDLIKIY